MRRRSRANSISADVFWWPGNAILPNGVFQTANLEIGVPGPAVCAAGEESFEMVVPPMKVRNFNFSEVAKF